ncbi:MAG: hypothetical protein ACREF3_10835 [Acetobacteraceae bacterium]
MKKLWDFKQHEYLKLHPEEFKETPGGACAALAMRWAKMVLKAEKDYWLAPQVNQKNRADYFGKAKVPAKLGRIQQESEQHDLEMKRIFAAAVEKRGQISEQEFSVELDNVETTISVSIRKVALGANLVVREELTLLKGFPEYWTQCSGGSCYLFSASLGHFFAGYVTTGLRSWDYYFFDSECGEYLANGEAEVEKLMGNFETAYKKACGDKYIASTMRLKVEYCRATESI